MAQPGKDEFNFDDFQYSGVKLTPVPDFNLEEDPTVNPPDASPLDAPAAPVASSEAASPLEVEDKKAKKKAKKEKPVKVKKAAAPADAAAIVKSQSPFGKQLRETSPFTVLLGLTVVMLLMAVIFLFVELYRYDLDIHATKGKQTVSMRESVTAPFAGYCILESEKSFAEFSI